MSSQPYDIILLPDPDLAAKAIRTSSELAPMGTDYTLSPTQYLPHVSIYMVQLQDEDLEEVIARLATIATATPALQLEGDKYVQSIGYIDVNYAKTQAVGNLQLTVVNAINPLRDGLRPGKIEDLTAATGLAKENMEKYGEHRIGELFRPHLTFTRFTNRQAIPVEDMGAPTAFNGTYRKLALCELGPHGTCKRLVKEFPLA